MDLAAFLAQAELTQTEFAARIGVHPITLNRWVNGHALPRRSAMVKIQEATGGQVGPSDLLAATIKPGEAA